MFPDHICKRNKLEKTWTKILLVCQRCIVLKKRDLRIPSPMDSNVTLAKLKKKNNFAGLKTSKYTFLKNASYKTIRSVLCLSLSTQLIKWRLIFRASVLDQTSHTDDRFLVKSPRLLPALFPWGLH